LSIDCDVHPGINEGINPALKYMTVPWRERLATLAGNIECRGAALESIRSSCLHEPADQAVLVPLIRLNAWSDMLMASVVAGAINDYFVAEWLPADPRLRLAILLPGQSPSHACEEIRKHASNPQVTAAMIPLLSTLLGHAQYQPVFAALESSELPLVLHPTGAEGLYSGAPELAGGHNFTVAERRILVPQIAQANLNSMICQGVFERFPKLHVIFSGFDVGWLMPLMWRMDMDWRRLRIETPWVRRLPSEYVASNVFVTLQGSEQLYDELAATSGVAEKLKSRTLFGSHFGAVTTAPHDGIQVGKFRAAEESAFRSAPIAQA
jgi:uncharacterized protein